MDSFANTPRDYDDGQSNLEEIPAEIQQYGWKPPVKLPDGSIVEGDFLAANHLNMIFNDLYKKLKSSIVVTKEVITDTGGYQIFSNGDIEMWGTATTGSDAVAAITTPVALPGPTRDVQLTLVNATTNAWLVSLQPGATFNTFTAKVITQTAALVPNAVVLWRIKYHKPRSNGA